MKNENDLRREDLEIILINRHPNDRMLRIINNRFTAAGSVVYGKRNQNKNGLEWRTTIHNQFGGGETLNDFLIGILKFKFVNKYGIHTCYLIQSVLFKKKQWLK